MLRPLIIVVTLVVFAYASVQSFELYRDIRLQKNLKEDHATINLVNFGLFDIQLWKKKALEIFANQIENYEVDPSAYQELDKQLQGYLVILYEKYFESGELIDLILEKMTESGSMNKMFISLIQKNIGEQLDNLDLRKEIPGLSAQLVSEIKKNEPQIKAYFQKEMLSMILDDAALTLKDRRLPLYRSYGYDNFEETDMHLSNRIAELDASIAPALRINVIALSILLLLLIVTFKIIGFRMLIAGLSLLSVLLLLLGITLPMIDIDARLNAFSISLMNEPISFTEQTIYFQSKSILDVTKTLWEGRGIDLKIVGTLVFLFSIIFPFTKLVFSSFYLFSEKVSSNKVVKNIIFHLGKWSMADVFVVAMFMAYIGFYGIVTSQLGNISNNNTGYAVETLNYSKLAPGALYFTLYTLLSIVIGIMINRHTEKDETVA